jgi:hypothetical protein
MRRKKKAEFRPRTSRSCERRPDREGNLAFVLTETRKGTWGPGLETTLNSGWEGMYTPSLGSTLRGESDKPRS